jgi:hypothetical protein
MYRKLLEEFFARIRGRMEKGNDSYQDRSFSADLIKLANEVQEEVLDIAGWGFILWRRIENTKDQLTRIRSEVDNLKKEAKKLENDNLQKKSPPR